MINSFGGEQDNVVFLGRRSFRMEVAGQPGDGELAVPASIGKVRTERLFMSERARAALVEAQVSPTRPRVSLATVIALCAATFVFGIALTLTFAHRPGRLAPPEAAPAAVASSTPAPVVAPLPAVVLPAAVPAAAPLLARPPARSAIPPTATRPARRPAVKRAPPVRAPKPWVDPFAE